MKTRFSRFISVIIIVAMISSVAEAYSRRTPVVEAFQKNKDAVVSISSQTVQEVRDDIFGWGVWDWPFQRRRILIPSLGSGFIIHPDGYIVTNAHVVRRATEITIIMSDNSKYQAQIIAADPVADIALLKIDAPKPLPTVTLGTSSDLMIGETVLAIGNPFGYEQTLTDGILSAIHRDVELSEGNALTEMLQISAPINPGNSGGPLLNINGEVIGINTAIRKAAQGIGFAIPIDQLYDTLPRITNIETIRRIDLGLKLENVKASEHKHGVPVRQVVAGSAAAQAGFSGGDVITGVNGMPVTSTIDFYLDMLQQKTGQRVTFDILRDGSPRQLSFYLKERPKPDGAKLARQLFGLDVVSVTSGMISRYELAGKPGNVMVRKIERGSPAYNTEIAPGDIIYSVGDVVVNDMDQLGLLLENIPEGARIKLTFHRTQKRWNEIYILQFTTMIRSRSSAEQKIGASL